MPVIDVRDVSQVYGSGSLRRTVLHDVTVRIEEPRVGIIGANGSGKSTFARLINGLVVPVSGSVEVDGLSTKSEGKRVRQKVGFCFTDPDAQIIMPTVREDIAFSLRASGLDKQAIATRVDDAMLRFGLDAHADHPAHLLSGGQKQLLALAAVLITRPEVLVLDEPTTLLDLRNAHMIAAAIGALDEQVLLVTHQLDLLAGFDRVLVFDQARLVCDDIPARAIDYYRRLMA